MPSVQVKVKLKMNLPKIGAAVMSALFEEANELMAASKRQVPVDTGTLRASGMVEEPIKRGKIYKVRLGYGYGEEKNPKSGQIAAGYAIYVHENLKARHKVGKAKFLEDPMKAWEPKFARNVGIRLKRKLGW